MKKDKQSVIKVLNNNKMGFRMWLDFVMTILILLAVSFRITGDIAHEWIGIGVYVLFVVHNVLNKHWHTQLLKKRKKYSFNYILYTTVNLTLIIIMSIVFVTGILQSRSVLAFWDLKGGMLIHEIHSTTAYWGYVLISIHIGLHWSLIKTQMFKRLLADRHKYLFTSLFFCGGVAIAIGGVWAFIERDIYSKLFLRMPFDFWNQSALLFIVYYILIMGLFVWLTHYVLKMIRFGKKYKESL